MLFLAYVLRAFLAIDQLEIVKEAKPAAVGTPLAIEQPTATRRPDQFDTSLGQYSKLPAIPLVTAKKAQALEPKHQGSSLPMELEQAVLGVQPEEYRLKLPGKTKLPDSVNALELVKAKYFGTQLEQDKNASKPLIDTDAMTESSKLKSVQNVNRNYFQPK
jgi:hypothetical protein